MATEYWASDYAAFVVPKCGLRPDGSNLALGRNGETLNSATQLVAQTFQGELAWWEIIGDPDYFRFQNIVLAGAEPWTGSICIRAPFANSPVEIKSTLAMYEAKEQDHYWKAIPQGDGFYSIQLISNPDQYLNVAGDDNYAVGTGIYSYHWGGGQANELWRFIWLNNARNGFRVPSVDD